MNKNLHRIKFITANFFCINKMVWWQSKSFVTKCCDWQVFHYCIVIFLHKCSHFTVFHNPIWWNCKTNNFTALNCHEKCVISQLWIFQKDFSNNKMDNLINKWTTLLYGLHFNIKQNTSFNWWLAHTWIKFYWFFITCLNFISFL